MRVIIVCCGLHITALDGDAPHLLVESPFHPTLEDRLHFGTVVLLKLLFEYVLNPPSACTGGLGGLNIGGPPAASAPAAYVDPFDAFGSSAPAAPAVEPLPSLLTPDKAKGLGLNGIVGRVNGQLGAFISLA